MTRKLLLTLLYACLGIFYLQAQTSQTIAVSQPGTLAQQLGSNKPIVTDLTITGTINSQDFQTIKEMAALKNLDMSNVDIDNGTIPSQAFRGKSYTKILLPKNVRTIGNSAFQNLTVPQLDFSHCKELETIEYFAFYEANIESKVLDFSKNLAFTKGTKSPWQYVGMFARYNGHVILPRNMKETPIYAFAEFLGTVDMPQTIEIIGEGTFMGAKPEQEIVLPEAVHTIGHRAFRASTLKKLTLPKNLVEIGPEAFQQINIPNIEFSLCQKLEKIGYFAFLEANVESKVLDFSKNSLFTIGTKSPWHHVGIFARYNGHVILPRNMKETPIYAFAEFLGTVDMPETIEIIGEGTFMGAKPEQEIVLPEAVHTIGHRAFRFTYQLFQQIIISSLEKDYFLYQ